ncbi:1-acyl-sn-glycerol-3-phosphate acyltransferase 1 [Abeliophyllum distichum]|uniref:1-acyl-sn-glycerol-3-phosphate acyltransferase n=1 Tax=Abeliophyllum distichum TaxID=126358 RepID=A0ABD1UG44_9LAMI
MASLKTIFFCLEIVFVMCTLSEAREFVVGGENKLWEVPSSVNEFNNWAQKIRFQIGDSLVLKYDSKTSSVLEVTEDDYKTCNKANPIKSYHDGETQIVLVKSGPFFFISGAEEHCQNDQKLEVRVLSDKHGSSSNSTAQVPSPYHHHHHHHHAPAPAPTSTNGVSGLMAAAGFVGGTAVVATVSISILSLHFTHPCKMGSKCLFAPSLRPVCCFSLKQPAERYSKTHVLSDKITCTSRRHASDMWSSIYLEKKFTCVYSDFNFHRHKKLSRYVVRSELAGAGCAGAYSYPLSEIQLGSKIRGICFYAVTAFTAIFLFVLMLIEHPLVLLFDRYRRKAHYLVAKIWATLTVAPFMKIEFEGLENLPPPNTPAVYVSNHQSFLDIYTLLTLGRSFKFISKTAIFLFPIIGWAMFLMGVIPLKRMDSRSQLDCLKQCIALIKKGASVFFFPEGTRSKDGKLGPFKKGAFSVAVKTGVPVVPITLIGTGKIMPAGMEGQLNPGSVKVVVHQPIEGDSPDALSTQARDIIADSLSRQETFWRIVGIQAERCPYFSSAARVFQAAFNLHVPVNWRLLFPNSTSFWGLPI